MIINYLSLILSFILPTSLNILAFNALSIISSPLKLLPGNDDSREIEASFLKPNVGSEYPFQKRPPNHLIDTAIRIKLFIKVWRLWKQRRRKRHATGLFLRKGCTAATTLFSCWNLQNWTAYLDLLSGPARSCGEFLEIFKWFLALIFLSFLSEWNQIYIHWSVAFTFKESSVSPYKWP